MRRVAVALVLVSAGLFTGCSAISGQDLNYNHALSVANQANETRTGHLEVVNVDTEDVVFEQRVTLDPGASQQVFDFRSVSDTGAAHFVVRLDVRNTGSENVTVSMNRNTGDVRAILRDSDVRFVIEV